MTRSFFTSSTEEQRIVRELSGGSVKGGGGLMNVRFILWCMLFGCADTVLFVSS